VYHVVTGEVGAAGGEVGGVGLTGGGFGLLDEFDEPVGRLDGLGLGAGETCRLGGEGREVDGDFG